ncbi:MAG: CsgG/HfaB family protein [Fibromonadaceae bacterium]|nr:CsgG/HfaB family protein [Fibromonadaceae bacterium]
MSLEQALAGAAKHIASKVDEEKEIAVVSIASSSNKVSSLLIDELTALLKENNKLKVVERSGSDLEKLMAEKKIQMSDLVDDNTAVSIGKYIGAKIIIAGVLDNYSEFSSFRLKTSDVKTAENIAPYTARVKSNEFFQP